MNNEFKELEINSNYGISNSGQIYSKYTNRVINSHKMNSGYLSIKLQIGNKKKAFLIHRLVLLSWEEKVVGKEFCNHKDGDKTNNNISNLEWVTKSENGKHSYDLKLKVPVRLKGKDNPAFKFDEVIKNRVVYLYNSGISISKINRITGVSRTHIYRIVKA